MTRIEKIEALRAARRQRSIEIAAALEQVVLAKEAGNWPEVSNLLTLVDQLDESRARTVGALDALTVESELDDALWSLEVLP